jgi:type VI secretion system protein ImpL
VKIIGITLDGRSVELLNVPGRFGLQRMFETAQRRKLPDGSNELSWSQGPQTVAIILRVISQPGATAPAPGGGAAPVAGAGGLKGLRLPAMVVGGDDTVAAAAVARGAASGATR